MSTRQPKTLQHAIMPFLHAQKHGTSGDDSHWAFRWLDWQLANG